MNNNIPFLALIVATFWVVSCNQTELPPTNKDLPTPTRKELVTQPIVGTITPTIEELTTPTIEITVTPTKEELATPSEYTTTTVETPGANEYIGIIYPPYPESVTTLPGSGAMIETYNYNLEWAIDAVKGDKYMLWLSKLVSHSPQGKASFQVSDVIIVEHVEEDYKILVSSCQIGSMLDPEIVVVAKIDEQVLTNRYLYNTSIVSAWRTNLSTGKFETLTTENIECWAEFFSDWP